MDSDYPIAVDGCSAAPVVVVVVSGCDFLPRERERQFDQTLYV